MKYEYFLQYQTIPEAVDAYAESDKTAVLCGKEQITYRELISNAKNAARILSGMGIKKGDKVVIEMDRSIRLITALLGILYAGGAYVAVDLSWPEKRREFIAKDCGASLILTDESFTSLFTSSKDKEMMDQISLPTLEGSDELAVYYTSGSTGEPKGCVTHHQVFFNEAVPLEENICSFETMEKCEKIFSMGNLAYGATACDIFSCLLYGKTLILATEEERSSPALLGECMLQTGSDALLGTPSMLCMYLEDHVFARGFRMLKRLIVTGEALSEEAGTQIIRATQAAVFDAFGASEVRNYSFKRVLNGKVEDLGTPVHGARLLLLDEDGSKVGSGVEGELCIGGVPGKYGYYIGHKELTEQKFTQTASCGRVYHTGDLAVMEKDGHFRMTGRKDQMLKLHGQRLEPSEIARRMEEYKGIKRAVADIRGEGKDAVLCAWYSSTEAVDEERFRKQLLTVLPFYMVPSLLMKVEQFPLNANGKLDRKKLPDIVKTPSPGVKPKTETERLLCDAFQRVLKTDGEIGLSNHFFLSGGDSIRVLRLIALLDGEYGIRIGARDLLMHPTPEALGEFLSERKETKEDEGDTKRDAWPDADIIVPDELKELLSDENTEAILPVNAATKLYLMMKRFNVKDRRNVSFVRTLLTCAWSEDEFTDRARHLVKNHPALRSDFVMDTKRQFRQIIYRDKPPVLFYKDISSLSEEAADHFTKGFGQVMEESGGLFSAAFFRRSEKAGILLIMADHTVADGASLHVIQNELARDDYAALTVDAYLTHRRRSIACAGRISQQVRDYYKADMQSIICPDHAERFPGPRSEDQICLPKEATGRLAECLAGQGITLYTWVQLCYAKALYRMYERREDPGTLSGKDSALWLMHVDLGRYGEWQDELRLVGNLIVSMPLRIPEDMTGAQLQNDLLWLRQCHGLGDSDVLDGFPLRNVHEGIISNDFGELHPVIADSLIIDRADFGGNSMCIKDGRLCITLRPSDDIEKETWVGFKNDFLHDLKSDPTG